MQRVYEPADLLEAEMLVGMLASEGIAAHVSGRHRSAPSANCRLADCWRCWWRTSRRSGREN